MTAIYKKNPDTQGNDGERGIKHLFFEIFAWIL